MVVPLIPQSLSVRTRWRQLTSWKSWWNTLTQYLEEMEQIGLTLLSLIKEKQLFFPSRTLLISESFTLVLRCSLASTSHRLMLVCKDWLVSAVIGARWGGQAPPFVVISGIWKPCNLSKHWVHAFAKRIRVLAWETMQRCTLLWERFLAQVERAWCGR